MYSYGGGIVYPTVYGAFLLLSKEKWGYDMMDLITQVNSTLNGIVWGWPALILLALYPFVWFSMLQAHSISCYWFTYRNLCVTVLAVLLLAVQRLRQCN